MTEHDVLLVLAGAAAGWLTSIAWRRRPRRLAAAEPAVAAAPESADAASRRTAALLAHANHEIRTPLNVLVGMSGLLVDSDLGPDDRECARALRSGSEALRTIVDDLFDHTQIEAGTLVLSSSTMRLTQLLEDCADLVRPDAEEKGLRLLIDVDPAVPPVVVGDGPRVRRLMFNLLRSAATFAARGDIVVKMTARSLEGNRHEIEVSVQETGTELSAQDLESAFQSPGSGLDPATGRRRGRTSLGLSVGRVLAERMGGRMWAESVAGAGCRFRFTIVAKQGPRRSEERETETPSSVRAASSDPGRVALRVLVAEDDPSSRRAAVRVLESLGTVPEEAENGREVLSAASRTKFDVFLIDLQMPVMGGLETVREIRRGATGHEAPYVIVMTASSDPADREAAIAAGADVCITKPLTPDALREALDCVTPSVPATSASGTRQELLNASVLASLRAVRGTDGRSVLDELVGLFVDDAPLQIARLREAADRRDREDLELTAHRLRGSSASIGAKGLLALASEVEASARESDFAAVLGVLDRLDVAWPATRDALLRQLTMDN